MFCTVCCSVDCYKTNNISIHVSIQHNNHSESSTLLVKKIILLEQNANLICYNWLWCKLYKQYQTIIFKHDEKSAKTLKTITLQLKKPISEKKIFKLDPYGN